MTNVDLHDANIESVHIENDGDILIFIAKSENGSFYKIIFSDVLCWTLTPFERQNIIFSIDVYETVPEWMHEDYNLDLPTIGRLIYFIDSSCGLGGVIFAQQLEIIKI